MSKKWKKLDPNIKLESSKYEDPIPSRDFILELLDKKGEPATHLQLCKQLSLSKKQCEPLLYRLKAMVRDGQLIINRKKAFLPVKATDLVSGTVHSNKEGFGFLVRDDGQSDIFLAPKEMTKVFNGDRVLVAPISTRNKRKMSGSIREILERNTTQLVGKYQEKAQTSFVIPDSPNMHQYVLVKSRGKLKPVSGDYVVVKIVTQPEENIPTIGKIVEVLGSDRSAGFEVNWALQKYEIPCLWPTACIKQANQFNVIDHEILLTKKELNDRKDYRQQTFITIDGEDAKDFDDAVFCEPKKKGGWKLYVAIADVSYYVKINSALDKEAFKRGTSIYFPDQVIPMLPEVLSNNLCSLVPNKDRLVMICEMDISKLGAITCYKFYAGMIQSKARLTYTQVGEFLTTKDSSLIAVKDTQAVVDNLNNLHDLYTVLSKSRQKRGALEIDTVETKICFGENRKIEKILPVVRNDAHKIIEECMLCANTSAANFIIQSKITGLFRIHGKPEAEKLEVLKKFLISIGYQTKNKLTHKDLHKILEDIKGLDNATIIQTMILRTMSKAVYFIENKGHFGLAYKAYTHFTSPIRRYPDLMVHRAIKYGLQLIACDKKQSDTQEMLQKIKSKNYPYAKTELKDIALWCSKKEKVADIASYEVIHYLKCQYIQEHLGSVLKGLITAVTHFGFFVELKDLYIEGLVHISNLPGDFYHYLPDSQKLMGKRTNKCFAMGDLVTVTVASVDLEKRKIDLQLL